VGDRMDEIMAALVGDGASGKWTGELKAKRVDGSQFDLLVSAATVRDSLGKPTGLMSTSIDITERMQAEAALEDKMSKIEKLNQFMLGREMRIVEMKHEVNALLEELGRREKYTVQ